MAEEHSLDCGDGKKQLWSDYETVFTNAKAGMEGVDKEKVKRVVYEMSAGSRFFANEQRKEATLQIKLEGMRGKMGEVTLEELEMLQKATDRQVAALEASRDLSRVWMHVDMDAFYAAVEALDDPSLTSQPMGVGGMGMLCTANYEARKYGVRAAMPGFIARKLCPQLVFVKPDFKKYTRYCHLTREVLYEYDPHLIATSLDEAYLDITAVCEERSITGGEVAEEVRRRVFERTHLTCSAGVAVNRLLAKVCSDINKPNGQYVLPSNRSAIMTFVASLPIRKVGGIGKVTEKLLLHCLGVQRCGQLLEKRSMLAALFSKISTEFFLAVGLGIGGSEEAEEAQRKSMSCERTFGAIEKEEELVAKLSEEHGRGMGEGWEELAIEDAGGGAEELGRSLAEDMAQKNMKARTLTLKLKTPGFEVRTRAASLPNYISTEEELTPVALKLLQAELPISVRLMGLRFSNFKGEGGPHPKDPNQQTLTQFLGRGRSKEGGEGNGRGGGEGEEEEKQWLSAEGEERGEPEIGGGGGGAASESPTLWSCETCTFLNQPGYDRCHMCEGSRAAMAASPPKRSRQRSMEQFVNAALPGCREREAGEAATCREGGDAGGGMVDEEYFCARCQIVVAPEAAQEHGDFHLAKELAEGGEVGRERRSGGRGETAHDR